MPQPAATTLLPQPSPLFPCSPVKEEEQKQEMVTRGEDAQQLELPSRCEGSAGGRCRGAAAVRWSGVRGAECGLTSPQAAQLVPSNLRGANVLGLALGALLLPPADQATLPLPCTRFPLAAAG